MPPDERQRKTLKEDLIRQGIPPEEIQKVYRNLKEKGYGEEEARRRSRAALEKLRAKRDTEERRRSGPQQGGTPTAGKPPSAGAPDESDTEQGRRAMDWLPEVPLWLRRRINRYAYRNGFLITRLPQRMDDFMTRFDKARPDCVSRALLALLADEKGFLGKNPYHMSFIDTLDALRDSAQRLLGQRGGAASRTAEEIEAELRRREPFAVRFFSVFTEPHDTLRKSLEFLGTCLRMHTPVRVIELARVVKDGCRFIAITNAMEREKLGLLFDVAREVNLAKRPGAKTAEEMLEAEGVFRACFQNLGRFAHELYPALLKMIGEFYLEEDEPPEKVEAVVRFLGLKAGDVLTWEGWERRMRQLHERELAERKSRELARLEQEKTQKLSVRFEGTLTMLSSLFPESGVERLEQGPFLLPYFANRIFPHSPAFQSRAADLENVSAQDIMGTVIVFHSVIEDMLASIEPGVVEKLVGREGLRAEFLALRDEWQDVTPRIFEPYLDAVREHIRETGGDPRYAALYNESPRARALSERINQLRNAAIRGYGHINLERDHFEGSRVYELASRLASFLEEVGTAVNQAALGATDPVSRRIMEELGLKGFVDFVAAARPSGVGYHPVTRQVKRWVEARFRETVLAIPQKAQVAFLDVLRGVAYLYDALLNDSRSPAALASHDISHAASAERAVWNKERAVGARDAQRSLQASLGEQFPGRFMDALTGLKNRDYFMSELPRTLKRLRSGGSPLSFLMIDIDHFKWVNDSLGHPRGDDVLKATAAMILDNIREGDLAVRYGGEEILILVPSDMHTGIILAERLRFAQESRVLAREGMKDVRKLGKEAGQPCATLSVGVADIGAVTDLIKAVEKADKALYAAKRTRNTVVVLSTDGSFISYAEYRQKASAR